MTRRKLNEAEINWDLPAGMFDQIMESVTNPGNINLCREVGSHFDDELSTWRQAEVWPPEDFDWIVGRIERCRETVDVRAVQRPGVRFRLRWESFKRAAHSPAYAAMSLVSAWIGDTRIIERKPLIFIEQIEGIQERLEPGDILLERRNWFLSNAFLPGFWPHGALYVGDIEDLERLNIADAPAIVKRLEEFTEPAHDGRPKTVIEAVSEGVIFNSLTHSMHADYVAVLRPHGLSADQIGQVIVRAFSHQGKPYDFEFDFETRDKLVCTELIYRAYDGILNFELPLIMGRPALTAGEIVRKFARE